MDTYNNMQPVGIEPPRMLGLNVDPSLAASAAGASVAAAHAQAASAALAAATTAAAAARSGGGGGGSSAGPTGPPGAGMEALSLQPFAGTPGGGSLAGEAGVVHRSLDVGRTADARRSMPELGRPGPDGSWRSVSDVAQRPAPAGSTHGSEDGGEAEWRGMPEPGRHGGNAQRSAEGGARLAPGMAAGAAAAAAAAGAAAAGPGSDGRRSMEAPALSIPSPMPTPGGGGGVSCSAWGGWVSGLAAGPCCTPEPARSLCGSPARPARHRPVRCPCPPSDAGRVLPAAFPPGHLTIRLTLLLWR